VVKRTLVVACVLSGLLSQVMGCHSLLNGWLDPTVLGDFRHATTMEIRTSLTLEDTPIGIPGAVGASQDDLRLIVRDYALSPGDTLAVEINELRQRQVPYIVQAQVSPTGYVNLPVAGRVSAAGLTVSEFEDALKNRLRELDILRNPEVTVNPLFLQEATYSIFGIGVSASNSAPLRAGTFPIRRPDLRVLEAINQVGGLNEFVTDVYVFRYDDRESVYRRMLREDGELPGEDDVPASGTEEDEQADVEPISESTLPRSIADEDSVEEDLIDAVVAEGEPVEPEPEVIDVPEELEPDPSQPYLWVDGEFVPNPAYSSPSRAEGAAAPPLPAADSAIPTVNWARIAGDTTYRMIRIPADKLRGGDPDVNIYIRAGDAIRIVSGEIGVYYVMGQVNRIGTFAFNAEPITLKAAIAAAGGLSQLAWPDRCTIYRRLGQREQMIQVDLDRVFAGKDPDFFIKRGDIINVGTHPFAPFLRRIRDATLPNIQSTMGYSFTYARNFADIDSFSVRQNPHNKPDRFPNLFP